MLFIVRPWMNRAFHNRGHSASRPIYAALYLFPILALIHGVMAGLICKLSYLSGVCVNVANILIHLDYAFPSIIILLSLMSHAYHFASRSDQVSGNLAFFQIRWANILLVLFQSWRALLYETVSCIHNLIVVIGHWMLHGFGLVALTLWLQPQLLAAILTLVPLPTFLYIVLSRFTDPGKFHSD